MIKVKDGYAKLIGTTYSGSSERVLLSNGGDFGIHTGRNNEANKLVRTDASGYILAGWINTTSGDMGTTAVTKIYCSNDNFIRYKTPANFFSSLTNSGDNISITVASQNRTLTVLYANIAGQVRSKGTIAPLTGRTLNLGDVYSYHLNSSVSGGPTTYAAVIGFGKGTSGTVEIAGEWTSGRGLWVRALRDTIDNWYTWDKILTLATYTGITDSRYYTKTLSDERFVNITGDTMTGELISTNANAYRLRSANYGVILRNDNSSFWILTTDNGSPSGSFNSLRPFRINLSDGRVTLGNGLSVTGTIIGSSTILGTLLISTIASGTSPLKVTSTTLVNNLNADLLDGWHGVGTSGNVIRKSGYLTSDTSGLSSYWGKVGSFTWLSQYNDRDITLYMHSAYINLRAIVLIKARWNSTSEVAVSVSILAGNIPTNRIRLYYDSSSVSSTLELWYNISGLYGCINTYVLSDTSRVGLEIGHITLYNTKFSSVQTPSLSSYVEANYVSLLNNSLTATKLLTARTINGTSFDGSANITTAYWGTTRTITLSGAVTGSASVNGSLNVTITTTYQTGSIDGRYVGGKKTAGHGSQGTAYTADTYSSNFVNKAFVAYAERGSWSYANNGYITTDTGVNIPLAGTAIFQWGASDTNKTLLFITPHNNSGVSNPAADEMLFYTSNGSGYTSAWTRVLTHRNYTTYTVTKTGSGASGTWGISITGTAAAARKLYKIDGTSRTWTTADSVVGNGIVSYTDTSTSGRWDSYGSIFQFSNADNPTPGTNGHGLTQIWSGTSNKLGVRWRTNTGSWSAMLTILTNTNYVSYADTRYVTALGTNGNYVTWTKNGTTNNLTVPYATASIRVNSSSSVLNTGLTYYSSGSFVVGGTAAGGQWGIPSDSLDASFKNGQCLRMYWGSTYYTDILSGPNNMGTTHGLYLRLIVNGSVATGTFPGGWRLLLDSYNYQRYGDTRYVTLTTNQTISGTKTFSTLLKFTVATGTSPFTVSSTTVVSNLNADLLDGLHASSFVRITGSRFTLYNAGTYVKILEFTISSGSLLPSISFSWLPTECNRDIWADFNINIRSGGVVFYVTWKGTGTKNLWCVGNGTTYSVWTLGVKTSYDPFGAILVTHTYAINSYRAGGLLYSDTAPGGTTASIAGRVSYANNADTLDGYHITTNTSKPFNSIPYIGGSGVIELGKYIDFHHDNTTGSDYSTRFLTTGNYSNVVNLPSASGTLALTSLIPTSLKNPYVLTILANGTTLATYDGSSAKTANITVLNAGSGLVHNSLALTLDNTSTDSGWSMINSSYSGFILKAIRTLANAPSWIENNYAAGICFGGSDTKGVLSMSYGSPAIRFAGGNGSKPVWWLKITGTSGTTYNLSNMWTGTRYWANVEVSTSSSTETSPTFGNATIKNTTSLKGSVKITNGPRYTYIHFYPNFITSPSGTIYYDAGSDTACTASRFFLRLYSYSSDGSRLAYYEDYKLPNTLINRTTNGYYDILTNKNTSVSGGGSTYGSSMTVIINGVSKTLTIPNAPSIPTVTNYYWANVKVSASSNTATTPTFSLVKISYSGYPGLLIIRSGSSNGAIISFANSNGTLGGIGMTGAANGSLKRYTADYQTSYTICDSNNTSFTQSLTSGTTIGTLKIAGTSYTLYCLTNVDTKVTNTLNNSTKFYITGTNSSSTNTGTLYFDNGVYVTTTSGLISSNTIISRSSAYVGNHLYLRNAESGTYADLRVNVVGTTSAGGLTYLFLGNNITTGNDNNAHGVLRLYGSSSGYTDIRCGTNDTSGYTLYLPGASGQIVYHTNDTAIGSSSKPIYISLNGLAIASSSTIGSSTKGIYINSGTLTSMTYSLNATINSGTSNKLAYYSGANAISLYSGTVGNSAVPVYISNGVPTALSDYSFRGTFNQPVVLISGYVYRSSVQYNTWYWSGLMLSGLSFNTYSVNGGVFSISFGTSKSIGSYTMAIALIRLNFWGEYTAELGTTSGTYDGRGTGNPNLTCSCSISSSGINVNIRAYRATDKNNDSWTSDSGLWKLEKDSIKSVNIIVIGYISD